MLKNISIATLMLFIISSLNAKDVIHDSVKCDGVKAVLKWDDKDSDKQYMLINGKQIIIDQTLNYGFMACITLKNKKYIQIEYGDGLTWTGSLYVDTKTLNIEDKPYSQEHINHLLLGN